MAKPLYCCMCPQGNTNVAHRRVGSKGFCGGHKEDAYAAAANESKGRNTWAEGQIPKPKGMK